VRTPVLYLAPWIDYGGSDKNTIDWFRGIDRERFAPSLITTQPSPNRRLSEIEEFVEEIWVLPDLMPTKDMPAFILDFLRSREVGVVHLMNSRLGFDLLPDIRSLPDPPGMVVQLHAEEADKSGYVRYVTTRYDDFIDRFSLTMEDLARSVHEYGVSPGKTRVIYIGVDAEDEFSPQKVEPIEALPDGRMHILFPARLVHQKDPLLMVEVAAALRDRGVSFQIHVLGEGELEDDVRTAIGGHGLEEEVLIHPPTSTPERWYAACDVMLLTSVFEGVPAVVFEAMAMEVPVVSPALPGNVELLGTGHDGLVEPRDSIEGYVAALAHLAEDQTYQATRGRELRERALRQFSLQRMADEHGDLYDEVLSERPRPAVGVGHRKPEGPPALAIASLEPLSADPEARRALAARLSEQSCTDVELIAPFDGEWPAADQAPQVHRIPTAEARAPLDALRQARSIVRGDLMLATSGAIATPLADPSFIEKILRRFATSNGELDAIAFLDVGVEGRFSFRALSPDEGSDATPHTIVWRAAAEEHLPRGLHVDAGDPILSIARLLSGNGAQVEWRHLPVSEQMATEPLSGSWASVPPVASAGSDASARALLPGAGSYEIPRWRQNPTWVPTLSVLATRYRERDGERRVVASGSPPPGFVAEHCLGALRSTDPLGTEQLLRAGDDYVTLPRGKQGNAPAGAEEIGYVELAPFPQLDCLALGVHRPTGQKVLVTLPEDPILEQVDVLDALGFIEPIPLKPDEVPDTQRSFGLVGLVKALDHSRRCHRYALGSIPAGELVGELGALAESELQGAVPVWVVDGRLVTEQHRPPAARPGPAGVARWMLEPTAWRGIAGRQARARTILRRGSIGAACLTHRPKQVAIPDDEPAAWLFEAERPGLVGLYAAYHPVTGDQLLTRSPDDPPQMGYGDPELIGFIRLAAPVTGDLSQHIFPVPWARRFGAVPREG
jgi:glycosyltransferase involved in cell wall biosynthesis